MRRISCFSTSVSDAKRISCGPCDGWFQHWTRLLRWRSNKEKEAVYSERSTDAFRCHWPRRQRPQAEDLTHGPERASMGSACAKS